MSDAAARLRDKIDRREALVGVVGLGYVGLPLALTCCEAGFAVLGFDTDRKKIEKLGAGVSYIRHLDGGRLERAVQSARLRSTADTTRLDEPDVILICVPTPLTDSHEPDLSFVEATARAAGERLRAGQLVVLESTTYPGTTDEVLIEILTRSGLTAGVDFFVAYSPERENPGDATHRTGSIPKVVGGTDEESAALASAFYAHIVPRVVTVSSTRVAEATKLVENIYRAVNIALVNELKMLYDRMGIDIWEVLDAAETKPFGFHRFDPGPGWGGHCIPVDPFYLSWKARQHGADARFIELAGEINVRMPRYVIEKLRAVLERDGKALAGSAILVLGLSYKKDVDDPRESPAFEIIHLLLEAGAQPSYHDPHIPIAPTMRSWPELPPLESVELTAEALAAVDAVVIVTDHAAVDYDLVVEHAFSIVDTRGVLRGRRDKVVQA